MGKLYSSDKPYTFDRVVRLLIGLLSIGLSLYILYRLKDALLPFFIAWIIAYMLNPIVKFFSNKLRLAHGLAVVLTLLSFVGVFILLGLILTPLIKTEISHINTMIANYDFKNISRDGVPINVIDAVDRFIDFKKLHELFSKESILDTIENFSPVMKTILNNTLSLIIGLTVFFLICLYLIFILLDYEKINALWRMLTPPKYRKTVFSIAHDVENAMNNYFRHQFLICCIIAICYATGFQFIGLPLAIVFGLFVGFVHMIPYLQVITFPFALLLSWLASAQDETSFWSMIFYVLIVYLIVQVINDLILTPRIMGKAMGLNPAIILLSLSIWGTFLGVVGMIIALPVTTLLLSYYKKFISKAETELLEGIIHDDKED